MKRTQASSPIFNSPIYSSDADQPNSDRPASDQPDSESSAPSGSNWPQPVLYQQARSLVPGLVVILLILLARSLGGFQILELKALDSFLRTRPAELKDKRILIVGIDEADIQQSETYPIPDQTLAALLDRLSQYAPRAIGLDIVRDLPVNPGYERLQTSLATVPNVIGVERISSDWVMPHTLPPEQVGFIDFPDDPDGFIRRTYLEVYPPEDHPDSDRVRYSFALLLAEWYLMEEGIVLDNGWRNPDNIQFGETEFSQLQPNSGSYVGAESVGMQMLINVRSGPAPFEIVSMSDVFSGRVGADLIEDRVVLIGITSLTVKDTLNSGAVKRTNPGVINGVEMHAHIVSQLISAVMDDRQMLTVWPDALEYLWIALAGSFGILLPRLILRPVRYVLAVMIVSFALVGGSLLGLWTAGWWIPVVPGLTGFAMNAGILPAFFMYDQALRSRIEERQRVIEQSYDTIHSGPLQTLALLLRKKETLDPYVTTQLETLNRELRQVYERLLQNSVPQDDQLSLGNQHLIDLRHPLHEVLYEVYSKTLERDFPGFKTIKVKIVKFEPMQTERLSTDEKHALCRFFEEALCNVGKHAIGASRIVIQCLTVETENVIRVEDNSPTVYSSGTPLSPQEIDAQEIDAQEISTKDSSAQEISAQETGAETSSAKAYMREGLLDSSGHGTHQASAIAQRLGGHFQRRELKPGMVCELRWPRSPTRAWRH